MKLSSFLLVVSTVGCEAFNQNSAPQQSAPEISRRNILATAAATATAAVLGSGPAQAADDIPTDLYFGVGVSSIFLGFHGVTF